MLPRVSLLSLLVVAATFAPSWSQVPPMPPTPGAGPTPPNGGYPQVQSSHCRYLVNAPSPWGTNASPFKLYTRSYSGEVRRGYPIEVSIMPYYDAFKFFNFTDFGMWAEPVGAPPARRDPQTGEIIYGQQSAHNTHLGVWQVYPQYAGGSSSMKCNIHSKGEDTVGSFEARMLELLKTQFPWDTRLSAFTPSARHGAAFLWYPDENTMRSSSAIKFIAKLKSFGQWFTLESTPWRVNRPPPPRPMMGGGAPRQQPMDMQNMMDQTLEMVQQAHAYERRLEAASNGQL